MAYTWKRSGIPALRGRRSLHFCNVSTSAKCAHVETFWGALLKTFPRRRCRRTFPRLRNCVDVETFVRGCFRGRWGTWKRLRRSQNVSTSRGRAGCFYSHRNASTWKRSGDGPERFHVAAFCKTFPLTILQNVSTSPDVETFCQCADVETF